MAIVFRRYARPGAGSRPAARAFPIRLAVRLRVFPQRDPGFVARLRHDHCTRSRHRHPLRQPCRRRDFHARLAGQYRRTHRSCHRFPASPARCSGRRRKPGAQRWALAGEVQGALGAIDQDLDLARYEPSSMRPAQHWLDRRRAAVHAIASLQGPLLIGADQAPAPTETSPTGSIGWPIISALILVELPRQISLRRLTASTPDRTHPRPGRRRGVRLRRGAPREA